MRAEHVVVLPYALDGDLCILQRVEYLAIQKLIAKLRVEALTSAALPEAEGCGVVDLGDFNGRPRPDGPPAKHAWRGIECGRTRLPFLLRKHDLLPTSAPNGARIEKALLDHGVVLFAEPTPGARL